MSYVEAICPHCGIITKLNMLPLSTYQGGQLNCTNCSKMFHFKLEFFIARTTYELVEKINRWDDM